MELTRDFGVTVRRDTNKDTYTDQFSTPLAAVRALIPLLSDDERVEVAGLFGEYCRHCGGDDPYCQCWNDE